MMLMGNSIGGFTVASVAAALSVLRDEGKTAVQCSGLVLMNSAGCVVDMLYFDNGSFFDCSFLSVYLFAYFCLSICLSVCLLISLFFLACFYILVLIYSNTYLIVYLFFSLRMQESIYSFFFHSFIASSPLFCVLIYIILLVLFSFSSRIEYGIWKKSVVHVIHNAVSQAS